MCLQSLRIFCSWQLHSLLCCGRIYICRRKSLNLNENLAVTIGGGFFGGILIGYALKKIIKIVAIIAGFFLAALAYLQYQQIANINWDKLQAISEDTLTTLANATQQIPGFDGNSQWQYPTRIGNDKSWYSSNWKPCNRIYYRIYERMI